MRFSTLRQDAYLSIRQKLMDGELPIGAALSEPALARELGMSRTPIREAIRQMENEGLLEYAPRFGVTVRMPERRELEEMYAVREALESYATAEAARRVTAEELQQIEGLYATMKKIEAELAETTETTMPAEMLKRFVATDAAFHHQIMEAAGNSYMTKLLEGTRLLARIFTATFWRYTRESLAQANEFHRQILESLRAKDADAARQWTVRAMQVSQQNALAHWEEHRKQSGQ